MTLYRCTQVTDLNYNDKYTINHPNYTFNVQCKTSFYSKREQLRTTPILIFELYFKYRPNSCTIYRQYNKSQVFALLYPVSQTLYRLTGRFFLNYKCLRPNGIIHIRCIVIDIDIYQTRTRK